MQDRQCDTTVGVTIIICVDCLHALFIQMSLDEGDSAHDGKNATFFMVGAEL